MSVLYSVTTVQDFRDNGVRAPLLVGGAALSEKFATTRIGPAYGAPTFYAKDAMTGLRIMNEIMDPELREEVLSKHIAAESKKDPALMAQVVRSWLSG